MSTSLADTLLADPTTTPHRIARGIWTPHEGDDLLGLLSRIAAALPTHVVFVGLTAARLLGLWVPPARGPEPIEVAYTERGKGRQMSRTRRPEFRGSRRQLPWEDTMAWSDVRVTTPARTWLDLAPRLRHVELVALGDSVLRTDTTPDDLTDLLVRSPGRRGVRSARLALPALDARSRSRPESHVRVELTVEGWPRFEVNTAIHDADGGWLAEPDLHDPRYRIAVEYQGEGHADVDRMRRDLTRATCVAGEFWQILSVGPNEAFAHPERMRRATRAMLVRAGWVPPAAIPRTR